uniref:Uncharacterized protein n=1 Tax=Amphimedon queenslandica TaxID=400682 RepID=A0A1X7SP35_AMPQE
MIQVGFYAGSIVFLFITTFVVSSGWGSSCLSLNSTKYPNLDCTGPRYILGCGPYPPNGADFITATVCSGVANVLTIITLSFFVAKRIRSRSSDEYMPLIKINDYELT